MHFSCFKSVSLRRLALVLTLALLCAGCSRFEKDWRTAAALNSTSTTSLAGRWQGTWKSDVNGHTDELRCLIQPAGEGQFTARYHARYRRGLFRFTFQYTVPLVAKATDSGWTFSGQADLGWLAGGMYRYAGTVSSNRFHSTYDSRYDRGTFEMQRAPRAGNQQVRNQ
jgi:hypothetical protein